MNERPPEVPLFHCNKLSCLLSREACVARQRENESRLPKPRPGRPWELARHDGKRGRVPEYPSCLPERCVQGRHNRERLEAPGWRMEAPPPAVLLRLRREKRRLRRGVA